MRHARQRFLEMYSVSGHETQNIIMFKIKKFQIIKAV